MGLIRLPRQGRSNEASPFWGEFQAMADQERPQVGDSVFDEMPQLIERLPDGNLDFCPAGVVF